MGFLVWHGGEQSGVVMAFEVIRAIMFGLLHSYYSKLRA